VWAARSLARRPAFVRVFAAAVAQTLQAVVEPLEAVARLVAPLLDR